MKRAIFICAILLGVSLASRVAPESFKGENKLVAKLTDEELARYRGLQYILSDSQKMEYLSLSSPDERARWLDRFWLMVDPTPTTDENEARIEHEQRVARARELFGTEKHPGWDERIEIFIRFGPPSLRASEMAEVTTTGLAVPKEYWFYDALRMMVTFTDLSLMGRYTYAVPQKRVKIPGPPEKGTRRGPGASARPFTPPNIDYIARERTRVAFEKLTLYQIQELEGMQAREASENFSIYLEDFTAIYSCDTDWKTLPVYFDIASFRGGDWLDRIDVNFEVPTKDLNKGETGGIRDADVELRVLVRDESLREVAFGNDSIDLAGLGDAFADLSLLPGQIALALEPGRYDVGIEARDRRSDRRAAFRTEIDLPAYTGSPSISDIQFASGIEETEENTAFVKGTLRIIPHPLRVYRIPHPVTFYFEIYGLDTDGEGIASYRVEYRIVPLEKRRWGPVLKEVPMTISSSFETSGYGRSQPQRLSIATDELWEGPFRLNVTVTDLRTGRTAAQSAAFSILE